MAPSPSWHPGLKASTCPPSYPPFPLCFCALNRLNPQCDSRIGILIWSHRYPAQLGPWLLPLYPGDRSQNTCASGKPPGDRANQDRENLPCGCTESGLATLPRPVTQLPVTTVRPWAWRQPPAWQAETLTSRLCVRSSKPWPSADLRKEPDKPEWGSVLQTARPALFRTVEVKKSKPRQRNSQGQEPEDTGQLEAPVSGDPEWANPPKFASLISSNVFMLLS